MTNPLSYIVYKIMAFVLSLACSTGLVTKPNTDTPITVDENANLSFVVFGDCQIGTLLPQRAMRFYAACEDLGNTVGTLDALVLVGDIAENGMQSEYSLAADILNANSHAYDRLLLAEGNHDVRNRIYSLQQQRFSAFNDSLDKSVPLPEGKYNYSVEINGYKMIVMGTDETCFEESIFSDEQLQWLDSEIAATQNTGKPVFVFAHQPLQNTNGLPSTWGSPEFLKGGSIGKQNDGIRGIFEKYDNVIFINGHLHTGTGEFTYEDCGAFKSLNVPAVGADNAQGVTEDAQGFVIQVYEDRLVCRCRVFGTGTYVDESNPNAVTEIIF